ncbi:MAG: transposase family protein, partial [Tannerella sp.]|nr:transposase family protein [Tannerella sp.]
MSLIECLQEVEDFRRMQGQRYGSVAMLLIIIKGILRGQYGYREIGRFCRLNEPYPIRKFGFSNGKVPSHASIRTFIQSADFASIQTAFHKWTRT